MSIEDMKGNIEHVIHIMFENRGFDTLLGWLYADGAKPKVNIPSLRSGELPFYGVQSGGETWQPDHPSFFEPGPYHHGRLPINRGMWGRCYMPPVDPYEEWEHVTRQIYGPNGDLDLPLEKRMRGFWLDYNDGHLYGTDGNDILGTATPDDLPVINSLAAGFAVSDMWFASAPTQTNPNRAFSLGGSSPPNRINNDSFTGTPYDNFRTIFGVFNDRKNMTAKIYADHFWRPLHQQYFTEYMFPFGMTPYNIGGSIHHFEQSVRHDALPSFSYLEPTFFGEVSPTFGTDYHPPGSLYEGEKFLKRIYDALRSHPQVFKKSLLIVTFDEHGGTYDHVPPPTNAPVPDAQSPAFTRYGVRVPTLLISPWVQPGTVFRGPWYPEAPSSSLPYDHTSVLATLMKWKSIPYQRAVDPGWLRERTAVAPTFENVITNVMNASWPDVSLPDCHVLGDTFAATGLPHSAIPVGIQRITNFPPEHPEHQRILAGIQARVTTEHELAAEFRKLIEEYGMRPR